MHVYVLEKHQEVVYCVTGLLIPKKIFLLHTLRQYLQILEVLITVMFRLVCGLWTHW